MPLDDRNAGSTSKAQLSCCTGEVSEGQTADPVFYGSSQSNRLVFIAAFSSFFPRRAVGEKAKTVAGTVPAAILSPRSHLSGTARAHAAIAAGQGPPAPPLSPPGPPGSQRSRSLRGKRQHPGPRRCHYGPAVGTPGLGGGFPPVPRGKKWGEKSPSSKAAQNPQSGGTGGAGCGAVLQVGISVSLLVAVKVLSAQSSTIFFCWAIQN